MTRNESSVLLAQWNAESDIRNHYRLLRTTDPFHGDDVFSVFLSTITPDECDEEFLYDITRNRDDALRLFDLLCQKNVTACTLADVVADSLA